MNKLIGNIDKIDAIKIKSTIFESSESIFISEVSYGESSEDVVLNYFYKIKSRKNFVDVFQITQSKHSMYIDPRSFDYNNMCATKQFSRDDLLLNRRSFFWHWVENPIALLEVFPFMEREVKEWIALFSENREISKQKLIKLLSVHLQASK